MRDGYEGRRVVIRRGRDHEFAFFYFSVIFGTAVYLIATAVCKSIFTDVITVDVLSYIF